MLCKWHKRKAITEGSLKVCKRCKKTTDHDPKTVTYCTECSKSLKKCRICGIPVSSE